MHWFGKEILWVCPSMGTAGCSGMDSNTYLEISWDDWGPAYFWKLWVAQFHSKCICILQEANAPIYMFGVKEQANPNIQTFQVPAYVIIAIDSVQVMWPRLDLLWKAITQSNQYRKEGGHSHLSIYYTNRRRKGICLAFVSSRMLAYPNINILRKQFWEVSQNESILVDERLYFLYSTFLSCIL